MAAAATTARPARKGPPHPWLKPALFTGALVPLAAILAGALTGGLGADPVATGLNQLGHVALVLLIASLACTPLKTAFGWAWPIRVRKLLGLFGFTYAALHVITYAGVDQGFGWRAILDDVTKRKFIFVGFAAFACLVPLAVTSTKGAVRRMGFARWKRLHRLAYLAGSLGAIHFILRVKKDLREPLVYAAVLGLLLLVRLPGYLRGRFARRSVPSAARTARAR